ncbi:hypothetical protein [Virgibacillus siamensis]|uniref:hypothetical protein n=1 Tax=Virgibacillus siamensis TaxID=480071 RepID=UPI0009858F5D|nr:hypothetical protein [Virgibacillus siamensis]
MRSVKMSRIESNILENRPSVNARLNSNSSSHSRIRRCRSRSLDEKVALTEITKASIERAKREGKMKMIGKRWMYYDPTE